MRKFLSAVFLFFSILANLPAAWVTVKTGTYQASLFTVAGQDTYNNIKVEYEIQVESAYFLISGQTAQTTYYQIKARAIHGTFILPSHTSDYRGGLSFKLDRLISGTTVYGGGYNEPGYFHLYGTTAWTTYGGGQCQVGDVLHLRHFRLLMLTAGGTDYFMMNKVDFVIPASPTTYFVTFTLPDNATESRRDYFATQSGNTIAGTFQAAGAMAREWRIGPLTSNSSVSLSLITGGLISWDPATGLAIPDDDTLSVVVNDGVTPLIGTSTTGGGTGTTTDPTTPVPAVPTNSAPVLPTPTGGGGGLVSVPGTTGTTTGATTGDISQVTAAVGNGANATILNATSNANGVIGAVNKSISALDKINATLQAQAAQPSGTDMGPTNGLLTGVNEKLTTSNVHLQAIKESLTAQKTERDTAMTTGTAAATSMANAYSSGVAGEISAAQSRGAGMVSAFNAIPVVGQATTLAGLNPIPVDNHYATQANTLDVSNSATAAGISGGSLDLNPFTSPVLAAMIGAGTALTICTWIKGFICWSTVIAFMIWTAGQVKENIIAHFQVPQMALPASTQIVSRTAVFGNSVGVVPAAGLYAVQCVAMSSLLLSLPVLSAAIFFDTGQAGVMTAAATAAAGTTSGLTGMLANAASYMFIILPVATLVAAYVNRLLVQFTGITQFIVTGVVTRTITL